MTDAPVDEEPVDEEPADDPLDALDGQAPIEFLASGAMRVVVDRKRYRLRRPGFGETKTLRTALEHVEDEIARIQTDSNLAILAITAEVEAIEADTAKDPAERVRQHAELQQRSRDKGRAITAAAEELRVEWWRLVFDTLVLNPSKPEMPSWVMDAGLPGRVMNHWRFATFRSVEAGIQP